MNFETLLLTTDARGVATLTLNRPDKHNVLSAQMSDDLKAVAKVIDAATDIRVVVLTGAGKSFCAGGDLAWMRQQFDADRATRMAEARRIATMLNALYQLKKPLIGRINGTAMGGGLGLMSVCDIAIAANTGKFGLTETKLGVIPATISPYIAARMGTHKTSQIFMNSRVFSADRLPEFGLAARVVPAEELDAHIETEIAHYLKCAPSAVARAKQLLRRLGPVIDTALIEETITALADTWETLEAQAGIQAFFDKTDPPWL